MIQYIEGELLAGDESFAIVVSRFNEFVTKCLLDGAVDALRRHGVAEERITVVWVPGSFEIPLIADRLAASGKFAAVCCLGAVIQGETTHHEYINQQVAAGIMHAGQNSGVPILFGVLTCQSMQQAMDRSGGKAGNKGSETAMAAVEMVNILKKLDQNGL